MNLIERRLWGVPQCISSRFFMGKLWDLADENPKLLVIVIQPLLKFGL